MDVEVCTLEVDGCPIRYWHHHREGAAPLVLIHGGGAHAGWWDAVLPGLAAGFDVVTLDLSGHGDSGHRRSYSPQTWAAEVAAVAEEVWTGTVSVVGHSMGGLVGVFLAVARPDLVERLVVVDSALRQPGPEGWQPRGRPVAPKRVYDTLDAALERFRLRPPETTADADLLRAVGRRALTQVDGGWSWKFDPEYSQRFNDVMIHEALAQVTVPFGIVYGELSQLAGPDAVAYAARTLGRPVPAAAVPDAYHHVPLDNPDECRQGVERVLEELARAARTG